MFSSRVTINPSVEEEILNSVDAVATATSHILFYFREHSHVSVGLSPSRSKVLVALIHLPPTDNLWLNGLVLLVTILKAVKGHYGKMQVECFCA